MKILMLYCSKFAYKTAIKNVESEDYYHEEKTFDDSQVGFIQIEEQDMIDEKSSTTKLINFIKWICRKNDTKKIVLHSFAHLSDSKADIDFTKKLFDTVENKIKSSGLECEQTPFGYFLDLDIQAPGFSLARVFKSL